MEHSNKTKKRKYVNGIGYCKKTHLVNLCKVAKELYHEGGVKGIIKVSKMLGYNYSASYAQISKYIKMEDCNKCGDRRKKYDFY